MRAEAKTQGEHDHLRLGEKQGYQGSPRVLSRRLLLLEAGNVPKPGLCQTYWRPFFEELPPFGTQVRLRERHEDQATKNLRFSEV